MAVFDLSVMISSVLAYYFGMAIGYSSGEFIVYTVGTLTANLNLFLTNSKMKSFTWNNIRKSWKGGKRMKSHVSGTISEYQQELNNRPTRDIKEIKGFIMSLGEKIVPVIFPMIIKISRTVMFYILVTILVLVIAVIIAAQALSYAGLSQPLVTAPLLALFSYGLGVYIGEAGAELKMLPKYHKLEKRKRIYELEQNNHGINLDKDGREMVCDEEIEKSKKDG